MRPGFIVAEAGMNHAIAPDHLAQPRSRRWTGCGMAGVIVDQRCAKTPEPAARMVARCLDGGHRTAWVAGDELYGGNHSATP